MKFTNSCFDLSLLMSDLDINSKSIVRQNFNKMVVVCVFGVPQHVNTESERQIWGEKKRSILLQHKDNEVKNTRMPDTVADIYIYVFFFFGGNAPTVPSPPLNRVRGM